MGTLDRISYKPEFAYLEGQVTPLYQGSTSLKYYLQM